MYFKIKCPHCEKSLKVREELAGHKCACPYCKGSVRIPQSIPAESEKKKAGFPGIDVSVAPRTKGGKPPSRGEKSSAGDQQPTEEQKSTGGASGWTESSDIPLLYSGLIGLGASAAFLAVTYPARNLGVFQLFWGRGWVPFVLVLLTSWSFVILVLKWKKLARQRQSMLLDVLQTELSPQITLGSLDEFEEYIHDLPGESGESFLVNRVIRGLEHFRVRKSAAETVTMMASQSEIDANNVASSYTIVKVFTWALPIMGFIGTVIGVSGAVAGLSGSLESSSDISAVKDSLKDVFGSLGVAFDTTLLALVLSLFVKIPSSALQKSEEDLVTWVDEYCNENLLKRLSDGREGGAERGAGSDGTEFREAVKSAMSEWSSKMAEMGRQAGEIQETLAGLGTTADAIQKDMAESINGTSQAVQIHFANLERGLSGLNRVLERLGEQQVIVQQVEKPRRRWFSRRREETE